MPSRWWLLVLSSALVGVGSGPASAGSIATAPATLGAGTATVAACGDLSGIQPDFVVAAGAVASVLLTGLPSTCNGASASVTVTTGATSLGSGGPVTVAAGAGVVSISPAAPTGSVTHVRVVIVGP